MVDNMDFLREQLREIAADTLADTLRARLADNSGLGQPFTPDQLRLIVKIACDVAAEMVFQFNDVEMFSREHPELCRPTRDRISGETPGSPGSADRIRPRLIPFPGPRSE